MAVPDFLSMPSSLQLAAIPLASGIIILFWTYFRSKSMSHRLPYPPGPPSKSMLSGSLSDVPTTKPWETYTEWGKKYGDIIHFRIYDQHMIVLNSFEVANDLLDKRSAVYSDRPHVPMMNLMTWDFAAGVKPYGNEWRIHRRLLQQSFRPAAVLTYGPTLTRKINDMLYGILINPKDFSEHYKTVAAAIIMSVVYGYDVAPENDYFVTLSEAAVANLSESVFTGANVVNAIPILRYLPAWFPGAGFKRFAYESRELIRQMREVPFDFVQKAMAAGTARHSVVTELMADAHSDEVKETIKDVAATGYVAGADTTVSAMGTFFYAMAMFPDVQRKAQLEIDTIVGPGRLVSYADRNSLPYVEALYREVLRWRPVLPLGLAHSTTVDDIYKGYYIPKGAIIFANIWAMSHDPEKYENPDSFNPDRYFDEHGSLVEEDILAFGFGRRLRWSTHGFGNGLVINCLCLSMFSIRKKKDASGNDIPLDGKYGDGLVSHLLPFECSVTPRSDSTARLITEAVGQKI